MKRADFKSPEDIYGQLFYDVHLAGIFSDGKTFADARAKLHPSIIVKTYLEEKNKTGFDLRAFIEEYFQFDNSEPTDIEESKSIQDHISSLWDLLKRSPDKIKKNRSSKIPLPYEYIVPGGRFNEIYYWDSYFTLLGLQKAGKEDLIEQMVKNFKYLIDSFGFIPNGNRSYFLSRSQPPFYSLMVKLLIKIKGSELVPTYLPSLVKEYNFWMNGLVDIQNNKSPLFRVIKLENKYILNRFYDSKDTPREEMFRDDWKFIDFNTSLNDPLFRNIRAACESGWDFSSRWLKDAKDLSTIRTTDLCPIDLNCLLWHLEKLISECYKIVEEHELSLNYAMIANNRKKAIQELFWNEESGFFFDYNWKETSPSDRLSLAGVYPLFFKIATQEQADKCAKIIQSDFLKSGGVVTSPYNSGQQWDAPNGWAPLQWMTIKGLLNYNHKDLAQEIALRWTKLNRQVYQATGKMLEKYNVVDLTLTGGGGEYPVQDGFGWTNGVYEALMKY